MSDDKTEILDFSYYLPVNIIFGCGKADTAGKRARPYGEKALIVTGRSSAKKSGLYDRIASSLEQSGMHDDNAEESACLCRF